MAHCRETLIHAIQTTARSTYAVRLKIDMENDILYLRLDEAAIIKSEEVQPCVILDYDSRRVSTA
jgi:hypothetical protein